MRPTLSLLQKASSSHKPLIKFLGKRTYPSPPLSSHPTHSLTLPRIEAPDPTPHVHPASPTSSLPDSFASYRSKAQQHGPLAGHAHTSTAPPMNDVQRNGIAYGEIGGHTGHELGKVEAGKGLYFDRSELPERFRRMSWTEGEIEAVGSGGASVW